MKLPLELITNQKIQSIITDEKNELFLTFGFSQIIKNSKKKNEIPFKVNNPFGAMDAADIAGFSNPKDLGLSIPIISEVL